jgi:GTP diphosphokinase / guanosine-3',5'-bis(diphosphate) 3'-diphosphatase
MAKENLRSKHPVLVPPEHFLNADPQLKRAWAIAQKAHEGQTRLSGEPYTNHLVEVFNILFVEWELPYESDLAVAAILHDTIEDTPVEMDMVEEYFGSNAARYVFDVSKFKSEKGDNQEGRGNTKTQKSPGERIDKQSMQKIAKGGYLNPNIILLKLADRLHNMRTLRYLPDNKKREISIETLEYASIAEGLGIWEVKRELEDLAFPYIDPKNYKKMIELIDSDQRIINGSEVIKRDFIPPVDHALSDAGIIHQIKIQPKGIYETHKKRLREIVRRKISPDGIGEVNDVVSIRILVGNPNDCYTALGIIHQYYADDFDYKKLDESFAKPKLNGYSAIQTTINTPFGALEYAITTEEKENFNQWGIISLKRKGATAEELKNYRLKIVFVGDRVVFTPIQSTVTDILYQVNPLTAASAISSLVNGETTPLTTTVENGSEVIGIFDETPRIAPDMSLIGKNIDPETKALIEAQKSAQKALELITKGRIILSQRLRSRGVTDISDLPAVAYEIIRKVEISENVILTSLEDLYSLIALKVVDNAEFSQIDNILDTNEVTNQRYTTIRVTGRNAPHVLQDISTMISDSGGDHRSIKLTMHEDKSDTTYTLRILVAGLNEHYKIEIRSNLEKDRRFDTVDVV